MLPAQRKANLVSARPISEIAGDVVVDADIGHSVACIGINGLIHLRFFGIAGDVVVDADNGCATTGVGINKKVLGRWHDDDGR